MSLLKPFGVVKIFFKGMSLSKFLSGIVIGDCNCQNFGQKLSKLPLRIATFVLVEIAISDGRNCH